MPRLRGGFQEKATPSSSPVSPSSASSTSSTATTSGGAPASSAAVPPTSSPISRSVDTNPPATFVQTDTSSFKHVVQKLTGSADTVAKLVAASATHPSPPPPNSPAAAMATGPNKPAFKLCDRRYSGLKNLKMIDPLPAMLSPALSPVTSLNLNPLNRSPPPVSAPVTSSADYSAISEKGFYLHPSPRGSEPPKLLQLFPET